MLGKLVTVDVFRVERSDMVNSLVERDVVLVGSDDIIDGILIRFRNSVAIYDECRLAIENGLAVGFFSVSVVIFVIYRHSNPLIR